MLKTIIRPRKFNDEQWINLITQRPKKILTSNSKLRKDGIYNFCMPAVHANVVMNGKLETLVTCESAGLCKNFCYASGSSYAFDCSMIKHHRNLQYMLDASFDFVDQIVKEIKSKRKLTAIRWHDSADFIPMLWPIYVEVMKQCPDVKFYAYTKMVKFFKELQSKNEIPSNLTLVYSFGGKFDSMIDINKDRHARIFKNRKDLRAAGYSETYNSDRNAFNPSKLKIGLIVHGSAVSMKQINKNKSIEILNKKSVA